MKIGFVHEFLLKGYFSKDVIQVPSTLAKLLNCEWSYITRPSPEISQIPAGGSAAFVGAGHSGENARNLQSGIESAVTYSNSFMVRAGCKAAADADVYIGMFLNFRSLVGALAYRVCRVFRGKRGFVYLKADLGYTGRARLEERLKSSMFTRLAFRCADWLLAASADIVSVETEDGRNWLSTVYRYVSRKVVVVRNCSVVRTGVNEEIAPRERRILAVSRLGAYEKATDILLEAFRIFSSTHPDWHLMLVGEGNERFTKIIEGYADLIASGQIQHVGYIGDRQELTKIYRSAEIFVQPSRWESFPTALIEAVREGCLPICTPVFRVDEALGELSGALTVPVDDALRLAEVMAGLVSQEQNWPNMRKYLAEKTAHWNWEEQLSPIAQAIRTKLSRRPSARS